MKEPRTIHDSDDGDSPLYVGIKYLGLVADQIRLIKETERMALREKGDMLFAWLNELETFYDLIANKTDIHLSIKEVEVFKYELVERKLEKVMIKVKEKDKYDHWFNEIELMIERNSSIVDPHSGSSLFGSAKYKNDKKIIIELRHCTRELLKDANAKHLIMPEGMKDMKELVKSEWIDREAKKDFSFEKDEDF